MALTDDGNMVMPVSPMGGYGGSAGFGGDWGSWIILFLIFGMFNGGWGNWGNGGNNQLSYDFPWLLNANNNTDALVSNGFQNAALNSAIGDLSGAVNGIAQQINANQLSSLERSFAAQTANSQNLNALQSQLANCCCENRLATANLSALVQSENCADREALSNGIRDIITNQTAATQRILDQMCSDKIDSKNEKIAELQNQLTMAQITANNNAQTAAILANNEAQTTALEQYLAPVPKPAYIVQNPNCCGYNGMCGCGA